MKNRITDIIFILFAGVIQGTLLFSPDYLGGNAGKVVTAIFIIASLVISWKTSAGQSVVVKSLLYMFHFAILFSASSIVLEMFTGITAGFYFNIFLFLITLGFYYFLLFRKLYQNLKKAA